MKPPVINRTKCIHCGAEEGLHQSETNLCPLHGIEEHREGHRQRWADTVFETNAPSPLQHELSEMLNEVLDDLKKNNYIDYLQERMNAAAAESGMHGRARSIRCNRWNKSKGIIIYAKAALIKAGYTEI